MESPENLSGQEVGVEQDTTPTSVDVDTAVLLLGAGVTAVTHPLLYVKLLIQVGHEPLPPTVGTTMFGRRVLYLPGFFSYAHHIVKVDGKRGLFRGLSPRIISSAISTMVRSKVKQVRTDPKNDQISLQFILSIDRLMSVRCMAQFVGREVKYGSVLCVCSGLIPHVLGEALFLWCCNLLAHFINTYAVDESIAVSVLTYPFMLVADLMAVNNCGLVAGLPPNSPIFKSWMHCWNHLSRKGHLFRGSSFFFRRVPVTSLPSIED
uniref:Mitochondrial carrier 1 n=1 Tax=Seriola lalandi dorsalis TaxID=1841481 RepID=A0A3B4Y1P9_SERLL